MAYNALLHLRDSKLTHAPYSIPGGIIYENNGKHLFCFYIFRPQIIHNGSLDSESNNNIVRTIIKTTYQYH